MSKIIVNRKLFITCRLCLDDLGVYQIVPEVKEQIQFCFDIHVEPFDGLPQLICNKCEKVLNNYYETKKKFLAKQVELKSKMSGYNAVHQTPRESIIMDNTVENNIESTSENLLSIVEPSVVSPSSWSKEYRKSFQCKFCNASYSAKKYLLVHLSKHKKVKAKFSNIFKKHCQVKLKKLDGKLNFTGSDDKVVYDKNKIIESHNSDHYIVYSNNKDARSSSKDNILHNYMDIQYDSSDCHSQSSEEGLRKRKSAKRRRIYSNSSTDTVILDDDGNSVSNVEPVKRHETSAVSEVTKIDNIYNIDNIDRDSQVKRIIEMCHSKYVSSQTKDLNNLSENTGVQLKRKILSIGRKIINTKDLNSTAFYRFLQYKNLNIRWIQNAGNVDSNFVKIMTKNENDKKNSESKTETGWEENIPIHTIMQFTYEKQFNESSNYEDEDSIIENNIQVMPNNEINVTDTADSAILLSISANDSKKLLNANPVANPKQLPKKSPNDKITTKVPSVSETDICMPIITSTTSLSQIDLVPEPPRIKVKPVSELLSKESMDRLIDSSKNTPIVIQNDNVITEVPNIFMLPSLPMSLPDVSVNVNTLPNSTILSTTNSMTGLCKSTEYLLLDTAELPNTRTNSPLNYLKKLLHIHNIFLLDTDVVLSGDFHCLIRFKVLYKQENKEQPVILCLSLHCHQNVFCLKVKNRNQEDIDMSKISANWQWEVLKIYRGEIVNKVLSNALKVSQQAYEYTNSFLCLIKSIKLISLN